MNIGGGGLDSWTAGGKSPVRRFAGLKALPGLEIATARFVESENHHRSERRSMLSAEEIRELKAKCPELTISAIVDRADLFGRRLGRSTVQNWFSGQGRIPRYIDEKQGVEVRDIVYGIVRDVELVKTGVLKAR